MLGLVLYAFVVAYGRMVRGNLWIHYGGVGVIAILVTVLTADLWPGYDHGLQLVVNFAILGLLFTAGHLAGRWLDRDKEFD